MKHIKSFNEGIIDNFRRKRLKSEFIKNLPVNRSIKSSLFLCFISPSSIDDPGVHKPLTINDEDHMIDLIISGELMYDSSIIEIPNYSLSQQEKCKKLENRINSFLKKDINNLERLLISIGKPPIISRFNAITHRFQTGFRTKGRPTIHKYYMEFLLSQETIESIFSYI